jgi:hypothetical protein
MYETVCVSGRHWDALFFAASYPRRSRYTPSGFLMSPYNKREDTSVGLALPFFCRAFPADVADSGRALYRDSQSAALFARMVGECRALYRRDSRHVDRLLLLLAEAGRLDHQLAKGLVA